MEQKKQQYYVAKPQWVKNEDGSITGIRDLWVVKTPGPFYYIKKEAEKYLALDSDMHTVLLKEDTMELILSFIKETVEAHLVYHYKVESGEQFALFATNMDSQLFADCLKEQLTLSDKLNAYELEDFIRNQGYYSQLLQTSEEEPKIDTYVTEKFFIEDYLN